MPKMKKSYNNLSITVIALLNSVFYGESFNFINDVVTVVFIRSRSQEKVFQ